MVVEVVVNGSMVEVPVVDVVVKVDVPVIEVVEKVVVTLNVEDVGVVVVI